MLKNLQKNDITIFVSTPYMDEASLCDRIALIQKGKILSVETPENITKQFGKQLLQINSDNKYKVLKDLRNYEFTNSVNSFGQFLHYTDKRSVPEVQSIKNYLNEKGNSNINIKEIMPNIEDCFMDLMIEDKN
jgi:ABC-type multidrug transport system ATPase subunit